jgi:hypothetical protein
MTEGDPAPAPRITPPLDPGFRPMALAQARLRTDILGGRGGDVPSAEPGREW